MRRLGRRSQDFVSDQISRCRLKSKKRMNNDSNSILNDFNFVLKIPVLTRITPNCNTFLGKHVKVYFCKVHRPKNGQIVNLIHLKNILKLVVHSSLRTNI